MKKYSVMPKLAVLVSTALLFISTSAFAQDAPNSEEDMARHDGGDRVEYLQEMDHSDPAFYVPPISDGSNSTNNNNVPPN